MTICGDARKILLGVFMATKYKSFVRKLHCSVNDKLGFDHTQKWSNESLNTKSWWRFAISFVPRHEVCNLKRQRLNVWKKSHLKNDILFFKEIFELWAFVMKKQRQNNSECVSESIYIKNKSIVAKKKTKKTIKKKVLTSSLWIISTHRICVPQGPISLIAVTVPPKGDTVYCSERPRTRHRRERKFTRGSEASVWIHVARHWINF